MKVLMIGPGIMPIPSPGWGAVETIIWQQKINLEKLGCQVDILNKRGFKAALKAKPWNYDLVHLHYDGLSKMWIKLSAIFRFPLLITTHYGYASLSQKWGEYYQPIFAELLKADGLLLLSDAISCTFRNQGFQGWIQVLPNGTEVEKIKFQANGNKRAICLGKIEPRKNQSKISLILNMDQSAKCDFVGPDDAHELVVDNVNTQYLGSWTREDVHAKLTEYSCLVLASDGEAHALVILEALAAGLSIVVTPEASANLDLSQPFIYVVNDHNKIGSYITQACQENHMYRSQIRAYAEQEFSWHAISKKYLKIANDYVSCPSRKFDKFSFEVYRATALISLVNDFAKELIAHWLYQIRVFSSPT